MPFEHVTWDLVLIVKNVRIRTLSLYLLRYRIKVLPQSHFLLYIRTLSFRLRSQSSIRTGFYYLHFLGIFENFAKIWKNPLSLNLGVEKVIFVHKIISNVETKFLFCLLVSTKFLEIARWVLCFFRWCEVSIHR